MEAWLQHPALQSAVVPLVVALVVALALERPRLSGLAVLAGALACVQLTIGLDLFPLNATRRIVALAAAAAVLGLLLDLLPSLGPSPRWLLATAAAFAPVWVLFTALSHRELHTALALGAGLALFCAVLAWGFDRLASRPLRAGCATLGTGLAAGASALLGASASLGQIGLAVGAAAGGYLLVQMVRGRRLPCGRVLTLPAALLTGLVATAAVVLAKLPWFALPVLALTPLAAALPFGDRLPPWLQAVVHGAIAVSVGLAAVAIAWYATSATYSDY
jgi:hypothetical protein